MPDSSGRIRRSAIDCMCSMLLSLTSIYEDADIDRHPRICVVFNNVSKVHCPTKNTYRYSEVDPEDEEETEPPMQWFDYITNYRDQLVETLKQNHEQMDSNFLRKRINDLFPDDNFYFYQIRENKQEIELEWK